jgi:hypothetical protein
MLVTAEVAGSNGTGAAADGVAGWPVLVWVGHLLVWEIFFVSASS